MIDYSIKQTDGRIVIHGAVPVDDLEGLLKIWKSHQIDILATGIASALGANMAICRKDDLAAWEAEIQQDSTRRANGNEEIQWLTGTDTGTSSRTIFSVLAKHGYVERRPDVPHDPSDFGRCFHLLELFPEWKPRLHEVAERYPAWQPLVREWPTLTELWLEESPTSSCPKLYDLMQTLRGAIR